LTGEVTQPPTEIPLEGFADEITHAEWAPGSEQIVFQAFREGDQQAFYLAPRTGGQAKQLFHFQSEQHAAGFGVSPDGAWIAYVAPANDGYLQLFRIPLATTSPGEPKPKQLTFDPANKTQPSYSPDGANIALTVWSYDVQFWTLRL
jgi:Tol biopolymer transport system component